MAGDRRRETARQDRSRLRLRGPYTPDARNRSDRRYRPLYWGLDSDWAGRAILNHYLTGGGNWVIRDDPQWRAYMMDNGLLRMQLWARIIELARRLAGQPGERHDFHETFAAEVENGEDINGYQYLHGTNMDVGGFQLSGTARVSHDHDNRPGETLVAIDADYQWNDRIDPNPQYDTDTAKSWFAEIITLGVADAYDISINWSASCSVLISPDGRARISGYPGQRPW